MTLPNLLARPSLPTPPANRDYIYSPPWKGGGLKSTQSALSALTLLAFLFFLNILQSCLKEQLQSQTPVTIVMTTQTTTTTGTQRLKREIEKLQENKIENPAYKSSKEEDSHETDYTKETHTYGIINEYIQEIKNIERKIQSSYDIRTAEKNSPLSKNADEQCCTFINCKLNNGHLQNQSLGIYIRYTAKLICPETNTSKLKDCRNSQKSCQEKQTESRLMKWILRIVGRNITV